MEQTVLIGGVFDPLHAGHLEYLAYARGLGRVMCALSDAPEKHPPLVPRSDRVGLLTALGVSSVIVHDGALAPVLERACPAVYLKGQDWAGRLPADEVETCRRLGIAIRFMPAPTRGSSSALLADYLQRVTAERLDALEQFVRTQPAAHPWQPVTDYSFEGRRPLEMPHVERILQAFGCVSVWDVGCGPGVLTTLLRERGVDAVGLDRDPAWLSEGGTYDLSTPIAHPPPPRDLVICREVLEHLRLADLTTAVLNLVRLSRRFVYVTTRFTSRPHLLDVDGSDGLDPTHITLVHQDLLRTLFVLQGCRRRPDRERVLDWRHMGRVLVYGVPQAEEAA